MNMKYLWLILLTSLSFFSYAAPKADPWPYWNQSNPANSQVIDHSEWQRILDNNLAQQGSNTLFDYSDIRPTDRQALLHYINTLTKLDPRQFNKNEQFAYWVNLYNAATVQLILDHYPITSITKLGGLFSFGPWDQDILTINGQELSLNDIEHRILRPIWQNKRIHYAVNCASLGCPNLPATAFTADNTQSLLKQAELTFINSSKGVNITNGKLELSSIYDWYAVDFGGEQGVLGYLSRFKPEIQQTNKKPSYQYNWALNEK